MKKIVNYQLADLNYTWSEEARSKYIERYTAQDKPNPAFNGIIHTDKQYATLTRMSVAHSNQYDSILDSKARTKWNVAQGGTFSQATLDAGVLNYYLNADSITLDEELVDECIWTAYRVLDNLGFIQHIDPIITDSVELYNCYKADHKSHAGFTGEGDRRDPKFRKKAIIASQDFWNLDPVIGGMRRKDGKDRNIFNDSLANYFRECRMYYRWFKWWQSLPYDMHFSDYEIANRICRCNAKMSYAADFKAMDQHRTLRAHKKIDQAFAMFTSPSDSEFTTITMFTEELYNTDLIAGNTLYQGTHTLFSGIFPTHDSEGMENFIQLATLITKMGLVLVKQPKRLKPNECYIMVCGDDSFILFGRRLNTSECEQLKALHAKIASAWGQIIELEKVDISTDVVTFCKKTFALRQDVKGFKHYNDEIQTPIHKYSLWKAVHNLRMPEKIPTFEEKSSLLIWMCSILDLSYGCADWRAVVTTICQYNKQLILDTELSDLLNIRSDVELYLNSDWYWRNYVSFSLPNSPTFQLIVSLKNNLL
jgi:hypothetical protein